MNYKPKGFTLIELLVVIAVISLLSSVVLTSLQGSRERSRYANVVQQMEAVSEAVLLYELQNGEWPSDVGRGEVPEFVPEQLQKWPEPPCGVYDYENWSGNGSNPSDPDIRVTLRDTPQGPLQYCLVHERMNDCRTGTDVYRSYDANTIHQVNEIEC